MSDDSEQLERTPTASASTAQARPSQSPRIRVLLGSLGWPSGVLEVASWAQRSGLAEAIVVQVQPGEAFRVPLDDAQLFAEGRPSSDLIDMFSQHGRRLGSDAQITCCGADAWTIVDSDHIWTYDLVPCEDDWSVRVRQNMPPSLFLAALASLADRADRRNEFFKPDGCLAGIVLHSLLTAGSGFLTQLIEFAPHVVGFRIESGQLEQVCELARVVRFFCKAEIVLGGPTATSHPEDVLRDVEADYAFAGEAEEPFVQFLRLAYQRDSRDRLPDVPGLTYRYGGRIVHNTLPRDPYGYAMLDVDAPKNGAERRVLMNRIRPVASAEIVTANQLDWSLLHGFHQEFDSLYFTGGRGCPGECTFCANLHGRQVRIKNAPQLLREIERADALVQDGRLKVSRWKLFAHVEDRRFRDRCVAWASINDEDFFLHRGRATEFFELWDQSPLSTRYRISLQTNPCSLLTAHDKVDPELLTWIDRLKPMVQLGAESFHPVLLARWHKRHTADQLEVVLDALDTTGQDYTVFQILTDFDTTGSELIEGLRRLILSAFRHPGMRIASTAYTIPLYDSETRRQLECRGATPPWFPCHFTEYERPQPKLMDPLVAELADLADAELHWALDPEHRDSSLLAAMQQVADRLAQSPSSRIKHAADRNPSADIALHAQAIEALQQIRAAIFQPVASP